MLIRTSWTDRVPGTRTRIVDQIVELLVFFRRAVAVRRERSALARLDDRILKDIGLSRSTAFREAHRGFFDLPAAGRDRSSRLRQFRTRELG